jgi:hypothetical protein
MVRKTWADGSLRNPYQDAYKLACDKLKTADLKERAEKSGALLEADDEGQYLIKLPFLNRLCHIRFPQIEVGYHKSDEEVPLWSKILILHYLNLAQGNPLTGKWINFRQVSGGENYYPAFIKRSQKPLLGFFDNRLELLEKATQTLGAKKAQMGDLGVIIPTFPRVPLAMVFWSGDEEFQSEANILFDSTISSYLSTEDIAVLSQQTVFTLIKWAKDTLKN